MLKIVRFTAAELLIIIPAIVFAAEEGNGHGSQKFYIGVTFGPTEIDVEQVNYK